MDIQCYNSVEVGKHLKMMQALGLPDHVLNMRHGVEAKETLGLGLGVGTNLVLEGNTPNGVSHNHERGEPLAWQMNTGVALSVCVEDQKGVIGHLASHMKRIVSECNAFEPKESEGGICQEQGEMKAIVEDVKVETELWRMESMEGMQAIEESRVPDQPVVEEGDKWVGLQNESTKVQDWYKHGYQERNESEQPKEIQATSKCTWQTTYQECQRNITAEKGTTVLDGCGEYMPAIAANDADDSLNCAACGCHRNFHRRAIRSEGDLDSKKGKEAPEDVEALSSICEIVAAIRAGAGRVLSLICEDQQKFKVKGSASTEQLVLFRSCIEALGHNAKAMLATAECLAFLLKSSEGATTCSQRTGKTGGLPALVPPDEMIIASKLEPKVGSPPLIFASETCPQAPFFSTKLGWHQSSFCAMDRAVSENSLNGQKRKRKRTRFTFEQLRKLNDFATRTGWTLAGVSKEEVDALCADVGIESVTLKYWIHNTRQKSRKKLDMDTKSPTRTP